jgi:hypothetical protein
MKKKEEERGGGHNPGALYGRNRGGLASNGFDMDG